MRWAAADTASTLGTGISTVVLPILVYDLTGSAAQTGLVFGLRVVPYLFFGLIAGPVADRFNRKHLVVVGVVAEGLVMATIPLADLVTEVSVLQIYVVTLVASVCFVFSDAATFGALPAITGSRQLAAANGALTALTSAALVAGPALGAVLTGWVGAAPAVWFDAASFLLAAALIAGIAGSFRTDIADRPATSIRAQAMEGLAFVWRERVILPLVAVGFLNSVAFGAVLGQVVVYADQVLHLPDNSIEVGLLFTAGAAGTLVAGLAFGRLNVTSRVPVITPTAMAGSAVIAFGLAATSTFLVAAGLYVVFSLLIQTVIATGITYRQLASPDHLRSSVNVVGRMVSWGGQPFGAFLGGLLSQALGVRWMTFAAGELFLVASTWAFVGLRRTVGRGTAAAG